jgi:hypothetical protein
MKICYRDELLQVARRASLSWWWEVAQVHGVMGNCYGVRMIFLTPVVNSGG